MLETADPYRVGISPIRLQTGDGNLVADGCICILEFARAYRYRGLYRLTGHKRDDHALRGNQIHKRAFDDGGKNLKRAGALKSHFPFVQQLALFISHPVADGSVTRLFPTNHVVFTGHFVFNIDFHPAVFDLARSFEKNRQRMSGVPEMDKSVVKRAVQIRHPKIESNAGFRAFGLTQHFA